MKRPSSVVIIGAGLGGMSAAIMLAKAGMRVTLIEKNERLGGKLNLLESNGFRFDLGPSIFTLPQVFRPLFDADGRHLEHYIRLHRVDPQWRNFFEDGTVIDLRERTEDMRAELAKLEDGVAAFEDYTRFLAHSRQQYHAIERGYLQEGFDGFWELVRFYGSAAGVNWTGPAQCPAESRSVSAIRTFATSSPTS
jgi:diapolycopene oxygenase